MKKIILNLSFTVLIVLTVLTPPLNAQIEKKELKLTPEMEEMLITKIKNLPESTYTANGIKDIPKLENLQLGKPIPQYSIKSKKLDYPVYTSNVFHLSDGDTFSVRFSNNSWNLPVLCDETPFLFRVDYYSHFGRESDVYMVDVIKSRMEQFFNYEYKDSIIGSIAVTSPSQRMDHLMIRKENQDIFVQIYDEVTGEYFKNEYRLSELIPHIKELALREKEARMRYYEKVAHKIDLKLTPEITEMLVSHVYSSHINDSDKNLSDWGITNRTQLEHLDLGKPIPMYNIVDENLIFNGYWQVPVMFDGEFLFFTTLELKEDGQYRWVGDCGPEMAKIIHNYEYQDLIIGFLWTKFYPGMDYLLIQKDNQNIFVEKYDYATEEYFKNEYSFNELLNLIKK